MNQLTAEKLNAMAKTSHENNARWWHNPSDGKRIERNKGELLMLVITELAEAVEGIRRDLNDDKLPHRKMEEVELADAMIRLLDYSGGFSIPIQFRGLIAVATPAGLPSNKAEALLVVVLDVVKIYIDPSDESHLSRAIHAIISYCSKFNLDLIGAYEEKTAFNITRSDHQHEARKLAGGKRF